MGYTNYFYQKKIREFPPKFVEQMKDLMEVAKKEGIECEFDLGAKHLVIDGPCENLVFEAGAEPLPWKKEGKFGVFGFCKTNRAPYDAVIKAAIMAGVENGVLTKWSFDGAVGEEEYEEGVRLAKQAGIAAVPPAKG